ncbi:MAG: hypothetical protein QMD99_25095 [Rhizobiaceae bacterium]|nr:hypothetical protein [Rhizobiaceae bacterium]
MDFKTARARLPSMTREVFGEPCTIIPMAEGRLKSGLDGTRTQQSGVAGRFDFNPEEFALGGGRSTAERATVAGESATVSFDRAALAWVPQPPDRVSRVRDGLTEVYEIVRPGRDGSTVVIFHLSRVS